MTSTISKKYILIPFFIIAFVLGGLLLAQVSATTIGANISTTGNLSADGTLAIGGTSTYTFGAAEKITIDAATTDHTDNSGVIDLDVDVDSSATNSGVAGQDILLSNNSTKRVNVQRLGLVQNSALSGATDNIAQLIAIQGNNSDTAGQYTGSSVVTGASYSGGARMWGYKVDLHRSGGTGQTMGMEIDIDNDSATSSLANGLQVDMDFKDGAPTNSHGIYINNAGGILKQGLTVNTDASYTTQTGILISNADQTMTDAVKMTSNGGAVTDGLDLADSDIVNAINLGSNRILVSANGTETPTVSSCGTSSSAGGTDMVGSVVIGGSGTVTSCTVNFNTAWGTQPFCVVTGNNTGVTYAVTSVNASSFTIGSNNNMAGHNVYYICFGF